MNKYLLLIFLFALFSCNNNNIKVSESNDVNVFLDTLNNKDNVIELKDTIVKFLITKNKIPSGFTKNDIIKNESYLIDNSSTLIFLELNALPNTKGWSEDPIYVLLFLVNNNKVSIFFKTSIIYKEDFGLESLNRNKFIFYEYSSSVGYSIYYLIDAKSNIIFQTERLDEGISLISEKIDFDHKKYFIQNNDTIYSKPFKNIHSNPHSVNFIPSFEPSESNSY